MGGSSQDARISAPVQSGGGPAISWQCQGSWADGFFLHWSPMALTLSGCWQMQGG